LDQTPVYHKVLSKLEHINKADISPKELKDAILKVCQDNGTVINASQSDALVNILYKSADSTSTGKLNRSQIKDAILSNMDKVAIIQDQTLPHINPVLSQIMEILDSSKSGTIEKKELVKALTEVAQ
jgi:Ca2+-binding EF-hand superfamily protein